jgi:hypothetical protein
MDLNEILRMSPKVPGWGGGKFAVYSVGCCWWTSFPDDLGVNSAGLPCCPHCKSVLMMGNLKDFIANAKKQPGHYGGIENFVEAHSRNSDRCHGRWDLYAIDIALKGVQNRQAKDEKKEYAANHLAEHKEQAKNEKIT